MIQMLCHETENSTVCLYIGYITARVTDILEQDMLQSESNL